MAEDSLLEFPCEFPIKMMGREEPGFRDTVRALVEKHAGPVADESVQSSLSRNGRFVSVTIVIQAESRQQLDDIYREVSAHEDVLMAL